MYWTLVLMEYALIYHGPRAFSIICKEMKWRFQYESMPESVERAQG